MRKIVLSTPISLDGFIEGPNRELEWVIADNELHDFYSDLLMTMDLILFGRVTYELMAGYWPTASTDPNASESERRYADTLNPMKKILYSSTVKEPGWNTEVVRAFKPEDVLVMKAQAGGNIGLGGGATLVQAFMQHGLVDEYQLVVQPVSIGEGKKLFKGITEIMKLNLIWTRQFSSGTVVLCYRPDGISGKDSQSK